MADEPRKPSRKPIRWIGTSREDLGEFPAGVRKIVGDSLRTVQYGGIPSTAKVLQGFGGASVLEIRVDADGATYRSVYTIRFARHVYVLHCFQKKSASGIKTQRTEIELVIRRLREAEAWEASE